MARSTKFATDFNIREALKRNRQLLTGAQESGRAALAGYEELAPQYNTAVERARNYQGTLTRDYNRYVQDRNQAVDTYNTELKKRYSAYQSAYQGAANQYNVELQRRKSVYENISAQGSGLERSYQVAQQELNRLRGIKDAAAQQANKLYGTYSSQYSAATKTGQQQYQSQVSGYQSQISNLQKEAQGYSANITALTEDIQTQQDKIQRQQNYANRYLNKPELGGRYVVDSTNKIYRVFRDDRNRYQSAQEYKPFSSGFALALGKVTDSGYGSLNNVIKSLSRYQNLTFADAVYERYRRGASSYYTYQAAANRAQSYSNIVQGAYDKIGGYQKQISNFQTGITNNRQRITNLGTQITGINTNLQNLLKDTGYVTRYAQQQSAGALQNYERYLQNTYNPSVNTYNQYVSGTFNPAAQAYQNFMGSGQVQQALRDYQSFAGDRDYANRASASQLKAYQDYAADTGFVDRAASDTKAVYDASQQEYSRLQAAYEGMVPQINEYSQQAETAKQQVLTLAGQAPGLQRSLAIDTEARKRGDRLGYRRSILSQGYKRRGAAR